MLKIYTNLSPICVIFGRSVHVDDIFHLDLDIREMFMRQGHEQGLHCGLVLALSNPLGCIAVIKWDLENSNFRKVNLIRLDKSVYFIFPICGHFLTTFSPFPCGPGMSKPFHFWPENF